MAANDRGEMESEFSDASFSPTAPPRNPHYPSLRTSSPPRYDAVLAQDPQARQMAADVRRRGLTESLSRAGASVGRFFGIHDDELQGWNRAGTLPPNRRALAYNVVPQVDDSVPVVITPPDSPPQSFSTPPPPPPPRGPLGRIADKVWRRKHQTDPSREEVMKTLPTFWPVMTVLIAVVEVGLLIGIIITGGLAPISFSPRQVISTVIGFDNTSQTSSKEEVPNFFIGTTKAFLIHSGAMYTPCMRENVDFQVQAANDRLGENSLRCCRSSRLSQCGMLPQQTCTGSLYEGVILGGASRCLSELNSTVECTGGVTLRPCCIGILGQCVVTTAENCSFQEGKWHEDSVLCSEVGEGCFNDICRFTWVRKTIGEIPSQGMRVFSAIFLYDGVITWIIIGLLKLYNSWSIEKRIGWLRIMCIYILSGIGGFLLSGLFDPTSVSVGGTGALFGLLGVTLVELLQGWKWVHRPWVELFKILTTVGILLVLGLLPYIDNFTQIGGFIFGVLASFIFVPYISIGKWDRMKKLCLISIALPTLFAIFLFGFVIFYNLPDPNFCPYCSYINCIPFTPNFCEDFITSILPIPL